jgi:hypothetical protein
MSLVLLVNAQTGAKSRQIFFSFFSNQCVKIERSQEGVPKTRSRPDEFFASIP